MLPINRRASNDVWNERKGCAEEMSACSLIEAAVDSTADDYHTLLSDLVRDYDARIGQTVPKDYFTKIATRLDNLRGLTPAQNRHVQDLIDFSETASYYPAEFRQMLGRRLRR